MSLFLDNIFAVIIINRGFNISIGCKLKKYKSSHLFDPFASNPISGTIINKKGIKEKGIIKDFNFFVSIIDIANNTTIERLTKKKMLQKKNNYLC